MNLPKSKVLHDFHEYLRDQVHWKTILRWLLIGALVFVGVVWFGKDAVAEIEALEEWIAGHGVLGWITFIILIVILNSVFVPLSVLALAGGAMFGTVGGTLLTFVGAVLTAGVDYFAASTLIRNQIQKMLEKHPKLKAIQRAFNNEGLRVQILLRMAPISAASLSYVLGATGTRFSTFIIATIGLLPSIIVNAYFGFSASHVTKMAGNSGEHSMLSLMTTIAGVIICVIVMIVVARVATKAITEAELDDVPEIEAGI